MAENWAQRIGSGISGRVRDVGSNISNSARHPGQTATRLAGRLLGGLLGPLGSAVGGRLADSAVNRYATGRLGDQGVESTRNFNATLSNQIFSNIPGLNANPISYGGMSGITSPQHSSYPGNQPPQQSPLASMLGLNNYNGNSTGNGLPGITSPTPDGQGPSPQQPVGAAAPQGAAQSPQSLSSPSSNRPITGAATSLGNLGMSVGSATMSQVEDMLASGRGRGERNLTQRHEINDQRAQARANGQTLAQFLGLNQ